VTFPPRESALSPPFRTVANRFQKVNRLNGLNKRWSATLASPRNDWNGCTFRVLCKAMRGVCLISKQPNLISAAVKFASKILNFYAIPTPVILRIFPLHPIFASNSTESDGKKQAK
jgi:hypothetical protein